MSNFSVFGFYFLRAPQLSYSVFNNLNSLKETEKILLSLKELFKDNLINEAILLASPGLWKEVDKRIKENIPLSKRHNHSLYKYICRMSTRCTPFGLFAGIAPGHFVNDKMVSLYRAKDNKIDLRLDYQVVNSIIQNLQDNVIVRNHLKYYPNNTLYRQNKSLKYYQKIVINEQKCQTILSAVQETDILSLILKYSQEGITIKKIKGLLSTKGFQISEIDPFIDIIIKNQFLISELNPKVVGEDMLDQIKNKVAKIGLLKKHYEDLNRLSKIILKEESIIKKNEELALHLKLKYPEISHTNNLQGDMLINMARNTICKSQINELIKQLEELQVLVNVPRLEYLEKFKKAFLKRYGSQLIPFLEALDPDTGIGYGNLSSQINNNDPILGKLSPPYQNDEEFDRIQDFILSKYYYSTDFSKDEINITEKDLKEYEKNHASQHKLPPTFYVIGNLLKNNTKNLDLNLIACTGTSAANLISRFGHISSDINKMINTITDYEKSQIPYSIISEIEYLPEPKTGNILQRPGSRQMKIPLVSFSEDKNSINFNDLYLYIKNDKLILWSKKLNSEIIPRITTAHNFHVGFHIHQFLGDLQYESGYFNISWDWGKLSKKEFLPRVKYKNIILSRKQWNIKKIKNVTKDFHANFINELINEKKIPNRINLIEGDNELFMDLENEISKEILYDYLVKKDIILKESMIKETNAVLKDLEGEFYNSEIIIPIKSNSCYQENKLIFPKGIDRIKRIFPLGSEWIYVKLYCGHQFAEYLIKNTIKKLIDDLKINSLLKRWFFIRYNDPEFHIRLRIQIFNENAFPMILKIINQAFSNFLENRSIIEIKYETYNREIERYLPECIELSEDFFHIDSEYVISLLFNKVNYSDRWTDAIFGVAQLLNASGMNLLEISQFAENMRIQFFKEFGSSKTNLEKLNKVFRYQKPVIIDLMSKKRANISGLTTLAIKRNNIIRKIYNHPDIKNKNLRESLLSSHIHMFINRLFTSNQRMHEFSIYHLLSNYYRMEINCKKYQC